MEVIKRQLNISTISFLEKTLKQYGSIYNGSSKKINLVNLFHASNPSLPENGNEHLHRIGRSLIKTVPQYNYLSFTQFGLIISNPNCDNQAYHIDYEGNSITFFIPMCDITDKNGTEYLHFFDRNNYLKYMKDLNSISYHYESNEKLKQFLADTHNLILGKDYCFKYVNCKKYDVVVMPSYVFHRGRKNETDFSRVMYNIVYFNNPPKMDSSYIVDDAELDESDEMVKKIKNLRTTY